MNLVASSELAARVLIEAIPRLDDVLAAPSAIDPHLERSTLADGIVCPRGDDLGRVLRRPSSVDGRDAPASERPPLTETRPVRLTGKLCTWEMQPSVTADNSI